MAITINGTGSITGLTAGGLPDGSVTAADIETSLDLTGKTVTLPSGTGGKILQVQSSTTTTSSSTTDSTWVAGHSLSITPSSTSNKIIVSGNAVITHNTYNFGGKLRITRTVNGTTTAVFQGTRAYAIAGQDNYSSDAAASNGFCFVDSPSTTSACTYAIEYATTNATVYFNYFRYRNEGSIASLVLQEVSA